MTRISNSVRVIVSILISGHLYIQRIRCPVKRLQAFPDHIRVHTVVQFNGREVGTACDIIRVTVRIESGLCSKTGRPQVKKSAGRPDAYGLDLR